MSKLSKVNLSFVVIIILAFVLGWQLGHRDYDVQWKNYIPNVKVVNQQPTNKDVTVDFKLFWDTWDLVTTKYIDKKAIDPQKLYYGAIQGMVAAIGDPYTVFLPPQAQKTTKEQLGGEFSGVGIQLGYNKDNRLVVIAPLPDTPASKAGVKPGDLIAKIDGKDATQLSLPDAVNQIRGPKGTSVMLTLLTEGETKTHDVTLARDTIVVKSADYQAKATKAGKKIAYIKLTSFGERTKDEWDQAVSKALADGAQGVVVDVRNNPGGFLDGAIYIGSEFIDEGNIVLQEDAQGNRQNYAPVRTGRLLNQPVVVLMNKGSASASEILAGAIQDHKRGKLVGDQSFGKGTIQSAEDLAEQTGIHITTAKWLTPDGRWIHNKGLTPDVKVEVGDDPSKDPVLDKALELLESM